MEANPLKDADLKHINKALYLLNEMIGHIEKAFPRLKGRGRIEARNKIHLQLLLTRQNRATQILEL